MFTGDFDYLYRHPEKPGKPEQKEPKMSHLKGTTYEELNSIIDRSKGYRDNAREAVIGNNTRARRYGETIIVSLHYNDIVQLEPGGDILFSLANWPTRTTLDRVNQFLPFEKTEDPSYAGFYGVSFIGLSLAKGRPFIHTSGAVHYAYEIFINRPSNWKSESKEISSNGWYSAAPLMAVAKSKMAEALAEEFGKALRQ